MTMDILGQFCGLSSNNYTLWTVNPYGSCYEQLVLFSTHVIFAILSGFHAGEKWLASPNLKLSRALHLRFIISITAGLVPLLHMLLQVQLFHDKPDDYLSATCQIIAWLSHSLYLWLTKTRHISYLRGHVKILLSWFLTLVSAIIRLSTVIRQLKHSDTSLSKAEESLAIIAAILHLFYVVTLIPAPRHTRQNIETFSTSESFPSINEDGREEGASLIRNGQTSKHYSAIPQGDVIQLGVAGKNASFFSKLMFWWIQPLMGKGAKGQLHTTGDVFQLPTSVCTQRVEQKFNKIFITQETTNIIPPSGSLFSEAQLHGFASASYRDSMESDDSIEPPEPVIQSPKKLTLLRALNKAFGLVYFSLGFVQFIISLLSFSGPLLLNALVSFMESDGQEPMRYGYYYALGLFLSTLIIAFMSTHYNYQINLVILKMRAAVVTTIYRKSLAVNTTNISQFSAGQIVNFMSVDSERVINFCRSFHQLWSLPVQIGVALYLLHQQLGLAFLAGLCFALLLIPINKWLTVKIQAYNQELMARKDCRVKMMNEVLYGIRVIKFYTWERHFVSKINHLRGREVDSLRGIKYLDAMCVYFWATTPVFISILTFTTYAALGHQLTAAKVFTSVALFNMLIGPLNAFPWVINGVIEAWVSIKRLQTFMELKELNLAQYYTKEPLYPSCWLEIQQGDFHWERPKPAQADDTSDVQDHVEEKTTTDGDEESRQPAGTLRLNSINIQIFEGQLVGVIGRVGSGKSSLLAAITAEMTKECGTISVANLKGGFGLATQESWIQHATLRDNILFGEEFDVDKYEEVIKACALLDDIKILPAGDMTEVGENGVTLSGGQKARLALARAVYQDKDIYLLDDPLAAVDAHVGSHIFSQCIVGLLQNKTRILCTHHTKYLSQADLVLVMDNGTIIAAGTPSDILTYSAAMEHLKYDDSEKNEILVENDTTRQNLDEGEITTDKSHNRQLLTDKKNNGKLVKEEEKDVGVVKYHVYKSYWRAVGNVLAPSVLVALFLMQASKNINDWWLSYWVTHSHDGGPINNTNKLLNSVPTGITTTFPPPLVINNTDTDNLNYWLGIYGGLAAANSVFTLFRAFLFAYGGLCAARMAHRNLLRSVLGAPISFFDVTPIGRIINRFSSDVCTIDQELPFTLNIFLAQLYGAIGTIVITCYGLPWFAVFLVPVSVIYYFIQNYYRKTSRELRRICNVSMSPIYAHFSETLSGSMTIRALRATTRFQDENRDRLEANQRARYSSAIVGTWLGFRLQMLGVAMITAVAVIAVLEHHFRSVNPGLVGLAISYALSITGLLQGMVQSFTTTEQDMVSMERAQQYIDDVPREKTQALLQIPQRWPSLGCVSFQGVFFTYRPDLPNALDGVTFDTRSAEKLGIVGRTGSGKSSLFLVLFRMVDIQQGGVFIDGVNVCHLGLTEYRSRLAIIPQDPFLFSGTVRENLDPSGRFSDTELWAVLDKCHLRETVTRLGGLEAEAAEKGKHFSAGQRQLVCLGRAMLTRAKVLCIDEATASVDMETDRHLQDTIRQEFADSTVLTIAHRINTILDSDRVMVMSNGHVAEMDTPQNLLQNPDSLFYGLVNRTEQTDLGI
ncbi:ATP-binding cassette sub-family C member 10-like [Amphiura filiformis]|uniref:ATP-binding cassette sub-family C member 10-like n=1 Tax=Amphiura filiformis TaxID=82378 RepID=UPI003B219C35